MINGESFFFVLNVPDVFVDLRGKTFEVPVNSCCSIWVVDVQCPSVAGRRDGDARNITVGSSIDFKAGSSLRFDVDSSVKMIGAELSKISG